jgi:hypothetical protein
MLLLLVNAFKFVAEVPGLCSELVVAHRGSNFISRRATVVKNISEMVAGRFISRAKILYTYKLASLLQISSFVALPLGCCWPIGKEAALVSRHLIKKTTRLFSNFLPR